ncbi:ATP-binding protein [Humisphaera borealis]|uniref:ATP-binding protein n=1 Tax=Humisphaera borealis TaxID=2807512 RepID=A0A7M2WPZ4_9BACT|nr:ATP-binding protein [Humisphaera borealis]QOV87483.1 ATP-binding protein [Humisphaera borealis]
MGSRQVQDPKPAVPPDQLHLRVSSDTANLAEVRRAVESYAGAAGFDEAAVAEIGLVVNEAMANVIRHAYGNQTGRPIELEAEPVSEPHHGIVLRLRMRDWGNGISPEDVPVRGYVPGEPGGLGLVCLKQMMDSVEYSPQPDGMLLTMTKRRAKGESAKSESMPSGE